MRNPRRKLVTLAATIGAAVALMIPSAAFADYFGTETDYAVSSPGPSGTYWCSHVAAAIACFKPYGDYFYVEDTNADGYAAVAEWFSDSTDTYRVGSCVNKLGAGHWGVCNKNLPESAFVNVAAALYDSGKHIETATYQCSGYVSGSEWDCF